MLQLDYYFQTDIYQVSAAISSKLQFPHFESQSKYGTGLLLSTNPNIQPTNKNILLDVKLVSLDDVLVVKNFEDLLTVMNNSLAGQYVNKFGRTNRFGDKYVIPYMISNDIKALKVISEQIFMIYNTSIINTVKYNA
jgi:hypothetical protein